MQSGRLIHDNIIVVHETSHYLKVLKKKSGKYECAIKFDMNKAYNRIEWDFLFAFCSPKMGFCYK